MKKTCIVGMLVAWLPVVACGGIIGPEPQRANHDAVQNLFIPKVHATIAAEKGIREGLVRDHRRALAMAVDPVAAFQALILNMRDERGDDLPAPRVETPRLPKKDYTRKNETTHVRLPTSN